VDDSGMKWKFWRKENTLTNLDPHMLAYVMAQRMVNREFPFNKWRDEDDVIPAKIEPFIEICVNVYQMSILLDLIELKFGSDVAGIVRSHMIVVLNRGDARARMGQFFDAVQFGRANPDREQFFAYDPAIQVDCNVARAFLKCLGEGREEKDAVYPVLGKALTLGRISAKAAFGGTVESIQFRPETIIGLRKPEDIPIAWSELCGCFERQLQRRHLNGLFRPERRRVSTAELIDAQMKDWADVQQLQTDMEKVFTEISREPNQGTLGEALGFRESLEKLILRAAAVGAIANQQRDALRQVYDSIVTTLQNGCPQDNRAQLDDALAQSEKHQATFTNQFLAQLNRKDTPIVKDEVVASLLTEDVETVRIVASTMDAKARKDTFDVAARTVANAEKEGFTVPQAGEKLRAWKYSPTD
jgi:hypothetical protein